MRKNSKHVPPALKHGIYSGIGLLPTESRAKFRRFKKQRFAELNLVGRLEEDIGEEIVALEWRRQNIFTYDLAKRAREVRSSIDARWVPPTRWDLPMIELPPHPENPSPEEIEAGRKLADKEARNKLGSAVDLVEIGDVATLD